MTVKVRLFQRVHLPYYDNDYINQYYKFNVHITYFILQVHITLASLNRNAILYTLARASRGQIPCP